jgi:CCR4-NOT transcription complex subunit 1
VTLIRSGLITVAQQDQQAAKLLYSAPRPNLQNFAASLIRECLVADPPVASQSQFSFTIEALLRLAQSGSVTEEYAVCIIGYRPFTYIIAAALIDF